MGGSEVVTADMAAVDTVTIDSNPAPVDESSHRVMRSSKGGVLEAAFQCEICIKVFSTAASLTSHRWQHTKPFQCEHCRQRFASKGNLVIHRRRHTGEKPYGCNLCDSKFSTKGNLKRHVQTHSGIKPWACNQCDGRFIEKKSLKIHMRKHTGERPYVCRVCGKGLPRQAFFAPTWRCTWIRELTFVTCVGEAFDKSLNYVYMFNDTRELRSLIVFIVILNFLQKVILKDML